MKEIAITKDPSGTHAPPMFREIETKLADVRRRAFDRFAHRAGNGGSDLDDWIAAEHEVLGWTAAELKERPQEFELDIMLAGFAPADIEITAAPDEIVVHAANEQRSNGHDAQVVWSEFGSTDVFRRCTLPTTIDVHSVKATLDNGLLRVTALKADAPRPDRPSKELAS